MNNTIGARVEHYEPEVYLIFRVFAGLLFVQHGAQKLFGLFGGVDGNGGTVSVLTLFGLAGIIEFFGGLLIAVGLLTRGAALFAIFDMIGAQVKVHLPQGVIPIQNGGELSLLFLVSFLIVFVHGARAYSIEHLLFDRDLL